MSLNSHAHKRLCALCSLILGSFFLAKSVSIKSPKYVLHELLAFKVNKSRFFRKYISQKLDGRPAFDMMQLDHVRRGVLVAGMGWFHKDPEECMRRDPGIHLHWGCAVRCRDTRDPIALAEAQRGALAAMERRRARSVSSSPASGSVAVGVDDELAPPVSRMLLRWR